ncbi:hypothetical protein [Nocardioides acrostichi]|uniref:ARB-07466-like C-terminal domain-containing protein n=1 Tax=Nocardioides acrostichi TaxID=2784339 RepID=A0A930UYH1_9ACTN|nr:hypothetical protein [Nocardioides acrostichi]MBF4162431.1 hypothetical protein [Nocardioides acrostichi]
MMRCLGRLALLPLLVLALGLGAAALASPASASKIEPFASYRPETKCSPKAKPGAVFLRGWLVKRYGGSPGRISAKCTSSVSEHQEGRAVDWGMDAAKKKDRQTVKKFLAWAFGKDNQGNLAAKARRMGIMYIIWNDRMYPAWDQFESKPYLSSSCTSKKKCSKTLRHRDHVHISLTRKGGFGNTSWYDGKLDKG